MECLNLDAVRKLPIRTNRTKGGSKLACLFLKCRSQAKYDHRCVVQHRAVNCHGTTIVLICVTVHRAVNCHGTTIVLICVTVHRAVNCHGTTIVLICVTVHRAVNCHGTTIVLICVTVHRAVNCHGTTIVLICVTVHRAVNCHATVMQQNATCKFTISRDTVITMLLEKYKASSEINACRHISMIIIVCPVHT